MAETHDKFEKRLAQFVAATKTSMGAAHDCAVMALENFAKGNNPVLCNRLYAAMPKNYVRKTAYLKWLQAHAPIDFKEGTIVYKKGGNAFDIKGATAIKFWDFAPDKENVNFTDEDVVKELMKVINRLKGERYIATNENAKAVLTQAEASIGNLKIRQVA